MVYEIVPITAQTVVVPYVVQLPQDKRIVHAGKLLNIGNQKLPKVIRLKLCQIVAICPLVVDQCFFRQIGLQVNKELVLDFGDRIAIWRKPMVTGQIYRVRVVSNDFVFVS